MYLFAHVYFVCSLFFFLILLFFNMSLELFLFLFNGYMFFQQALFTLQTIVTDGGISCTAHNY